MKPYKYSLELQCSAIELYKEVQSSNIVSRELGVSLSHVKRWLRSAGVINKPRRVPKEIKTEIMRLYLEVKLSPREIGARLNMTPEAIGTHLHSSGERR